VKNAKLVGLSLLLSTQVMSVTDVHKAKAVNMFEKITGGYPVMFNPDGTSAAYDANGVPIGDLAIINQVAAEIEVSDYLGAAQILVEHPQFYVTNLRSWFKGWVNRDFLSTVPFNDSVALMMGLVRDNRPFNEVLSTDKYYVINKNMAGFTSVADYSPRNNNMFAQAENLQNLNSLHLALQESTQISTVFAPQPIFNNNNTPPTLARTHNAAGTVNPDIDVAGLITTRNFGENFMQDGTNRRVFRYLAINFLCKDLEDLSDVTRSDAFVGRDVERIVGGDPAIYSQTCRGCHAGQDALRGAFAKLDYNNGDGGLIIKNPNNAISQKYARNTFYFPQGYVTDSDSWTNLWSAGKNSTLGWSGPNTGVGPKSLGAYLANSNQFSVCMAKRVFERFCNMSTSTDGAIQIISEESDNFRKDGYKFKNLVSKVASRCL
jgi:hypothetical protein